MSRRFSFADLPPAFQAQARAALGASPKGRKYRNQPVSTGGVRFDSKLEYRCWQCLELRKAAGDVLWFVRQVPFILPGAVRYRADFLAVLAAGGVEVIDAKGFDTPISKNKRAQVHELYGVTIKLWPGVAPRERTKR